MCSALKDCSNFWTEDNCTFGTRGGDGEGRGISRAGGGQDGVGASGGASGRVHLDAANGQGSG